MLLPSFDLSRLADEYKKLDDGDAFQQFALQVLRTRDNLHALREYPTSGVDGCIDLVPWQVDLVGGME